VEILEDVVMQGTVEAGATMTPMAPLTSKEKQEAYRARQAMLGHKEVRGVFLPPELHAELRQFARALLAKHRPERSGVEDEPQ
jgi:hypothetical protein